MRTNKIYGFTFPVGNNSNIEINSVGFVNIVIDMSNKKYFENIFGLLYANKQNIFLYMDSVGFTLRHNSAKTFLNVDEILLISNQTSQEFPCFLNKQLLGAYLEFRKIAIDKKLKREIEHNKKYLTKNM